MKFVVGWIQCTSDTPGTERCLTTILRSSRLGYIGEITTGLRSFPNQIVQVFDRGEFGGEVLILLGDVECLHDLVAVAPTERLERGRHEVDIPVGQDQGCNLVRAYLCNIIFHQVPFRLLLVSA